MRTTSNRPRTISRTSSGVSNRFRMIPTSIRNLRLRRRTHSSPAGAACTSLMPGETNDGGPGQVQRLVRPRFADPPSNQKPYLRRPRPAPTLTLALRSASGQEAGRQQRIDKRMLINTLDLDDLVRAVGYLQ